MEVTKKICKYYLDKKKRYCKFEVYKNADFCSHHHDDADLFMPCPIDLNHTVLKSNLEKHLQICPKVQYQKKLEGSVWYKENVNIPKSATLNESGYSLDEAPEEDDACKTKSKHFLQEMAQKQPDQYTQLLQKITEAFHKALELYKESLLSQENISGLDIDTLCSEEYLLDMKGHIKVVDSSISDTQKNIKQCDDLVQGLNRFGLLQDDICYIEYGAGKGQLSHHIALAVKKCSNILIELEGRRHKMDKNHREERAFYRIRADIKDFDINKVPMIFNKQEKEPQANDNQEESKEVTPAEHKVVGVSKHMCGLASDLTFYSILNASYPVIPFGFMIATCCHHRCTQELYMNQDFLDKLGLAPEMKKPFFHTSSWGIFRENLEKSAPKDKTNKKEDDPTKLDSDTKTLLGLQVKRTLDIGRVLCLREKGFNCYLIKYCEKVYSPENMIIVGRKADIQAK